MIRNPKGMSGWMEDTGFMEAVPQLTMVMAPFFCGNLFFPALLSATILDHTTCVIQDGDVQESWEGGAAGNILQHPSEYTMVPLGALAHSLRTTGTFNHWNIRL